MRLIVLAVVSDSAGANVRMKGFIHGKVVAHNSSPGKHGKVLFLDVACIGHILVGLVGKTFAYVSLIPRHTDRRQDRPSGRPPDRQSDRQTDGETDSKEADTL